MKLRVRLEEVEIEWGTGADARDSMSPGTVAFVTAAAPFVIRWLEKQGFTWFDRKDPTPASSETPPSSEPEAAAEGQHVVDGEPGPFQRSAAAARAEKNNAAAAAEV